MQIKWGKFRRLDGNGYKQIEISDLSDLALFEKTAAILSEKFSGEWLDKVEGVGQRYWHYSCSGAKLTLHLEHYLGITLYPTAEEQATKEDLAFLEKAYELLSNTNLTQ